MSTVQQYRKILNVAETLLSKIDLPQETFDKYNEFKDRILEESGVDYSDIESQLKTEIIAVYHNFVATCTEVMSGIALRSDPKDREATLANYIDFFNRKKKLIKQAASDDLNNSSVESKISLQRLVDQIDEMEKTFDQYIGLMSTVEDQIKD